MLYFKHILRKIYAFFEKVFCLSQNFTPYYSKSISPRNLEFAPVGFGYKITTYTNFYQNQKCSGFFVVICHGMTILSTDNLTHVFKQFHVL